MIHIKSFTKRDLFKDYDLEINPGLTFFKGKNGSGKTTLFDCISGLDRNYKGTITGATNNVYLNQNLYFSGRLKAKDMVQFLLQLDNIINYKEYYFNAVSEYDDYYDFKRLWDKKISYLSGGEIKLLFFSIITSLKKDIYILDEPYASLDSTSKDIVTHIVKKLVSDNKTILITSHEEEFIKHFDTIHIVNLDIA